MRLFTASKPESIRVMSSLRIAFISLRRAAKPNVSTPNIAALNTPMSVQTWGSFNAITSLLSTMNYQPGKER